MVVNRDMVWLGWQESAACDTEEAHAMAATFKHKDGTPSTLLELFYSTPSDPNPRKRMEAVQKLCNACPVQHHCIEYALTTNEPDGVWGGLTKSQRDKLKRTARNLE